MHRYIITIITALFLFQGCSTIKGLFGKKSIGDPNDPDFLNRVQTLKSAYRDGNIQALEAVKIIIDIKPSLSGKLLLYDGITHETNIINLGVKV